MAVQPVLRMGDPELNRVSEPVTRFGDAVLGALIRDMWETMAARGGLGIAAPQIGVPLRVVVFEAQASPRYPESPPVPRTVLVNPEIECLDAEMVDGWEGCLSVPGLRGVVPRYRRIRYSGFDADGRRFEREAEDFHARVVQHECDHLDGILYPQRMRDLSTLGFEEELSLAGRFGEIPCEV
ncbi:MAG: peptide deformylase [Gammaproteobacteria bacterium]|nr:peptide deformylase [Gammaproteobacteria bacterium]NIM72188.1 peptide deformylase [Gammaproteobacteria bacterium]NIN39103.1 peptide deformylase [Gammaproteobacteria bacterium]NIO23936.1 peptide deformylase [Gammaproteobacteria bacterium]NIO64588.1 peptide deformylase [Gammaproteobacteria bacterium]